MRAKKPITYSGEQIGALPHKELQYTPLEVIADFFKTMRTLSPEMPTHRVLLLFYIAVYPGLTKPQMERLTSLSANAITQNLKELGDVGVKGEKGLNLITYVKEEGDKAFHFYLNTYGAMLLRDFLHKLKGVFNNDST